jgi:hypothetical protein
MVRLFTFSRSKRSDIKKSRTDIEQELPENWESLDLQKPKNRFKRPSEILKGLNVSLMSKMEELRVLPLSYTFDEIGSFFYDEIEFYNTTETSSLYKHFYLQIVDRSQSLPIILLNKEFLLEKILEKYTDKYFQPICSRLLIALVRDCGREIETLFTERIIPAIASTIKVVDVSSVEVGFKVFASALKFLMKDILKNPIYFIKAFLSSMIRIKNAYIRKFTSEAVVFIVSKIRQKDLLNKVATELFGLTLQELKIEDQGQVMVQNFEDFKATLLFMILRGDQGSISEAGVDIKEYVAQLMSSDSLESVFFKKTFNLLIENEYRFFKNRESIEASKVVRSVYLEDYLTEIYEANHKSSRLAVSLLSVLTEIMLFGSGQRFTDKLEELSEKLLNKSRTTIAEEGIIFLAKFLVIRKRTHSFFPAFAEMDFDVESIHTFLNNIFRRSSFKRVEIFKEFKKEKLDIHTELETPVLSQSLVESILGALITTLSKSIKDTKADMHTKSDIAILTCSLLEKNLKDFRFKLEAGVYGIIKNHLFKLNMSELVENTTEDSDDNLVYYLSLLRITKFSQNYEADTEFITQASSCLKKLEDAFAREHIDMDVGSEHVDLNRLEDQDYLRRFDPLSINYTVYSKLEIKVLLQCELIQSILSNPNASAPAVQACYNIMESLLMLRNNYTPVIQTLLMVKRAALAISKRQNKPAVSCVKQNGNALVFELGSEHLNLRVFKYLWSEVPESRISCLKFLLTPKSQLYAQLMQLDTTDIAFYKERELFLLSQQISTDVYYSKYSAEETNILFHFLVGFSSFRISTLQSPLNQALSYILFRSSSHFTYYQDRLALTLLPGRDSSQLLATSRIARLWSGEVDVVQGSLRQMRLLDGLEKVLAEQGKQARFDGERQTHAKGSKIDADGNKEEATDNDMDANKIQENRDRLTSVFRILQTLLKTEIAPHILPSLNLLFADNIGLVSKGVNKDCDISEVIQMARDTMSNEFENEIAKKKRIDSLEKLKRIIKGMKSSFTLSNFEHRQEMSKYLLEIIKYPNDELQIISLNTYLKATKENKIIKQHAQLLIGLTSKDGFKDNLMKMTEKLRTLTDMEREHIIPVLNVILYRRLIDKTGTNNRKRFKAQRDFIFDIAANFSESEMNSLIRTLFLAHGLPLTFTSSTSSVVSDNNRLSLSRLLQFTTLSESLLKRLGSGMKPSALLEFGQRMTDCLSLAERGLKHLAAEKERITITVKALKALKTGDDDDEIEIEGNQDEFMVEEPVEQPEDQEDKEAHDDDANDQDEKYDDKDVEDADLELDGAMALAPEDRTTLLILKYLKQIKQDSFKRIVQLVANFVELDYTEFYANLMPIVKPSISNLGTKTLVKVPTSFKLLGVWSECELYKKYFYEYPFCFEALIAVINNPNSTAAIYMDAFEIIRKIAYFGLSEDNETYFNQSEICQRYLKSTEVKITMKDPITNEDDSFSSLGVDLVNKYSDPIVDSLATLSNSLDKKGLKMIRASDLKNLNKKISEFSLFISTFCSEGASTAKFYEVTKKAWSVEYINKKTSKPFFKIDSAQELNAVQKEKEIAANMIKILANFCGKIADITQIFTYYFLPMVARLDDLKLRLNLIQCYHKFIENSQFEELGIDKNLLVKLGELHTLAKSLVKVSVDYHKIVDFLIDIGPTFTSMSENEKRLIIANCLYWLTVDEMSTREKSLSIILSYMKDTDLNQETAMMSQELAKDQDYSNRAFYKNIILETVIYFYQSHFGREHVMKYFTAVMRGHALKSKHETFNQHVDYTDLSVLIDETNPENDFFELIFNIKLVLRGQAVKVLKKLIKKKGILFAPSTIKRIFSKIFDYYLYEYWRSANKEENRGSNSRLDSIRHILETVFEVYGLLVGQLPFSAFVRFVKDKIFQLDGKSESYAETSVKVICSALNNLHTNLPNVLEKIKADQAVLNEQALKMSVMNRFLDAYKDQTEISNVRANFDINLPEKKDGATLANELAEMKEDENKEIDALLDDEEEEERIEQATLSDSQYRVLKLHILGPLKRYLCKKDEKESTKSSVRPDVAIAIIQIIKLFPNKVFITELIGTLSKICSVLLDRDDERRKTARTTLTNMLKVLGPFFLGYFIKELSFHLKRGYEVHIRNYMIYKLIETVVKPAPGQGEPIKCGQIDYVVPTVAPLLVDEICGDLDEEKEVKEIKTKTVEFRKNKGIESFKLLAQKIDFKGDALTQIMECFKSNFMKYSGLHRVSAHNRRCLER